MPAPFGNRNAARDDSEKLSAILHARVHPKEKAAWVRAARLAGADCTADWVREQLNGAAGFDAARYLGRREDEA